MKKSIKEQQKENKPELQLEEKIIIYVFSAALAVCLFIWLSFL